MITFKKEEVLALHSLVIQEYGGSHGVRDDGILSLAEGKMNASELTEWLKSHIKAE